MVYEILEDNNLGEYYNIDQKPGIKPKANTFDKYKYLDVDKIADKFFIFKEGEIRSINLSLPNIHCSSCIYLLENLHKINPHIVRSELNFIRKEAHITFNISQISLSSLASLLDKIGYPPRFENKNKSKPNKNRTLSYQIGVTAFCMGNIMLYSFPEYLNFGEEYIQKYRGFFSALVLIFSIPILLYAAKDYLISAYKGLKSGIINIDIPISIGILALYLKSTFDIFNHLGPGYMDSFAGFIFFLLIGKWFQNKTYQNLSFDRDYTSYFPLASTVLINNKEEILPIEDIKKGDNLLIRNEEIIPADALLESNRASLDFSFVTGESKAITKQKGELIYAGGKNMGEAILIKVEKEVNRSYLTSLWNQKEFSKVEESAFTQLTAKVSKYFIIIVLGISILAAIAWYFIDAGQIINVVTAVLIVACPCALALAIPFTFGNSLRAFGRNKLYLKNINVVEDISKITDIIFDKTGTITETNKASIQYQGIPLSDSEIKAIASLVHQSNHPLSRMLFGYLNISQLIKLKDFKDDTGKGLSALINGKFIKIGSANYLKFEHISNKKKSYIFIQINNENKGYYIFNNEYRIGFKQIINELKLNYTVHILSGDNDNERKKLMSEFGLINNLMFNQNPIDKLNYIKTLTQKGKKVMMLGDGINDAGALKVSNVGLVLTEDIFNFTPASDGIMSAEALNKLPQFIKFSKTSIKVLKIGLIFSLIYNTIGLFFAVSNMLSPIIAAILMPISSITVVLLSTILVRYFEKKVLKQKEY